MPALNTEKQPLVSVIVPTYNRAYCLGRTIQSVMDQTIANWELILVDNHSSDDTENLVASYTDSRIKYLKIRNEGVIAASRNRGIYEASGKYLAFLDSDDWWAPQKLEKSVQAFEAGADFVYHDLYLMPAGVLKPKFWKKERTRLVKAPVFDDLLSNGNAINNSSVVIRRELMEKIDGFSMDRQLIAAEDYDAWLRVSKMTDAFERLPDCLGYYSVGPDSLSGAERTIINVKRLSDLYSNEIEERCGNVPTWMSYSLAKSYLEMRQIPKARIILKDILVNASGFRWRSRVIVWLLISNFYRRSI